jgi:hypothetical protein
MTTIPQVQQTNYRFSGHETFPCRYSWLPKAVRNLADSANLLSRDNEDKAMVRLGVGKNMVRAIRFWATAAEVVSPTLDHTLEVSDFGKVVFGPEGYDQFLEDIRTLWLIHWNLSSSATDPLFAWHYFLNFWHRLDFTTSEAIAALGKEAQRFSKKLSSATLNHHFSALFESQRSC